MGRENSSKDRKQRERSQLFCLLAREFSSLGCFILLLFILLFFLFLMRNVINGRTFNLLGSVASEKLLEVIDRVRRLPSALRNFNFIDGSRKKKNDEE